MTPQPQHLAALATANSIRLSRSALKAEVFNLPRVDGRRRVAELVLDPPAFVEAMTIAALLTWPNHHGSTVARRLLDSLPWPTRVGEHRPVGRLTQRERRAIAAALTSAQAVIDMTFALESKAAA